MGKRKIWVTVILAVVIVLGGFAVLKYKERKELARQALQFQIDEPVFHFEQNVRTNDRLLWNGVEYRIDHSPLSVFGGYKELFGDLPEKTKMNETKHDSGTPVGRQKEDYRMLWAVVGDSLYLVDIVSDGTAVEEADYARLEQLTGVSFQPVPTQLQGEVKQKQCMPARWVSGPFYVKGSTSGTDVQEKENRQGGVQDALYKITFEAGGVSKIEKTRKISPK